MTGEHLAVAADPEAVPLGRADVPEMLDLTARAKPGPFLPRTFELGTYLGIHRRGKLVAMAGERLHPEDWTEISAVCTDEAWRGQGLATRLIRAVGAVIRARGDIPFLHAVANNPAIGLAPAGHGPVGPLDSVDGSAFSSATARVSVGPAAAAALTGPAWSGTGAAIASADSASDTAGESTTSSPAVASMCRAPDWTAHR
jgi:GNAT superfamily N-acetyltransferase